jgi:hypothetical protein
MHTLTWKAARIEGAADLLDNGDGAMTTSELEKMFANHQPSEAQSEVCRGIRQQALQLAREIDRVGPDSREKGLALANLEGAVMWADANVVRNT